jgi:hypothetical protein
MVVVHKKREVICSAISAMFVYRYSGMGGTSELYEGAIICYFCIALVRASTLVCTFGSHCKATTVYSRAPATIKQTHDADSVRPDAQISSCIRCTQTTDQWCEDVRGACNHAAAQMPYRTRSSGKQTAARRYARGGDRSN